MRLFQIKLYKNFLSKKYRKNLINISKFSKLAIKKNKIYDVFLYNINFFIHN